MINQWLDKVYEVTTLFSIPSDHTRVDSPCNGGPGADAVLGAAVAGPRHPGHRGPDHQLCGG